MYSSQELLLPLALKLQCKASPALTTTCLDGLKHTISINLQFDIISYTTLIVWQDLVVFNLKVIPKSFFNITFLLHSCCGSL